MIGSKVRYNKPKLGSSYKVNFVLKIILFGLVAGFISSILLAPLLALVITIMTWLFLVGGNFLLRLFVKKEK